ncbi:IPT/TIG domain-containing protein [Oligoflexus tunisiensis]|uniref:IPT/TIG domain-containing protein n=1 Tax=Oligoflexus tunisiensis TaxID=708132 RepID=UPI000A8AB78D|nr:IPT/TIG domain-containing protein [Oligoflexus tunisiensis]
MQTRNFALTLLLFFLLSCNKLQTAGESNPITFSGITGVQASSDNSYIITWKIPFTVFIENYEVYVQPIDAEQAKTLSDATTTPDTSTEEKETTTAEGDISRIVTTTADLNPMSEGRLVALVSADRSSFRTASLDEGYYLFQVRALSVDGRRDSNTSARLIQVSASQLFKGLQIAEVIGSDAHLKWIPYPNIRATDTYQYIVYKGPAFNERVAYTKESEIAISLLSENAGDTLYYGVRFVDARGVEETNTTLLPLTVPVINKNYLGCLSVQGLGADRVKVNFEWPSENYSAMRIYRDQQEAFVTLDRSVTSFIDRGLVEGEYYTYTCQGVAGKDIIAGSNQIKGATLSSNSPTFRGITNVQADSAHKATVSWGVTTGVPAQSFQVYANPGTSVDWASTPASTIEPSVLSTALTGLGDDLPYAFGVRACGVSVCDPNTEQIQLTMPDDGAPKTIGAESAVVSSGQIVIQVPWSPAHGGVLKRKVYTKIGGEPNTDISTYTLFQTINVTDVTNPPRTITLANMAGGKTYHIIVRDEDQHGQISSNTRVVTVAVGDLSPPAFNGLSANGLAAGPAGQEETTLTATFQAIQNYQQHPRGAFAYRFYIREGGGAACAEDYYKFSVDALLIPEGSTTYTVPGLTARTLYSVCIKVIDANGNLSTNTNYLSRQTQDKTAPDFDGLQTLTFDADRGVVKLTWNPSTAADISTYKIDTWLTLKNETTALPITIQQSAAQSPNSFSFDSTVVPFQSEATLEVVVNACDNADVINGGTKNCSPFARAQGLSMTFADIQPPPGFMGIAASSDLIAATEGQITVKWIEPSDWSDYAGFQIYTLDSSNNLTLVKDCACTMMPGCLDHLNACDVTGLDTFRTYRFHVRAYDTARNYTILDPMMSFADKRTVDLTKPVFVSNLSLSFQDGGSLLNWAAATDNQYTNEEGAALLYRIYRKTGTNFGNLLNPSASGPALAEIADRTYFDAANLVSGTTYYYTVCAVDTSGNEACDGTYKSVQTPDLVPPTISAFATNKTSTSKSWDLTWTAADNTSSNANLLFRIKARMSSDPTEKVLESDATIYTATGSVTATGLTGPMNTDTYIHYLLMVTDEAGNTTTRQIDIHSQNLITISAVRTSEGPTTGNRLILIEGSGFHSSSAVTIGGTSCQNIQIVSSRHILCRTPAKSQNTYSLTISNSDGSSATMNNAYTYCTADVNCTNICNNPASWETTFAMETGRGTTLATPYIICNATHLNNVRTIANGRYFSIMENIDLDGVAWTPLVTNSSTSFQGNLTGNGNIIANLSHNNASQDYYGFIRIIAGNSKVSDLKLVNVSITARDRVGALVGDTSNDANTIVQNIMMSGTVTGRQDVGGIMGRALVQTFDMAAYGTVTGTVTVGGVIGYKNKNASNLYFEGTVSSNPTGSACNTGGVVGYWDGNDGTASEINATATVLCERDSATDVLETGGLIGRLNDHTLSDSWFIGSVTGDRRTGGAVGGLVRSTIDGVQVQGTVTGGNSSYTSGYETGGMVGLLHRGVLTNCTTSATVTSYYSHVGGLVGNSAGGAQPSGTERRNLIQSCSAYGDVTNLGTYRTGGAIGSASNTDVTGTSANGDVNGARGQAGGFLGWAETSVVIDASFANGDVVATGYDNVGGFVGVMDSSGGHVITNSFAKGDVSGNNYVGGFAGQCRGTFTKDYATGVVVGNSMVGGFCGRNYDISGGVHTIIEESYATGSVSAAVDHVGGFIGYVYRNMEIRHSYATGEVTGDANVGGFAGSIDTTPALIEKNYSIGRVIGKTRVGGFLGYGYRYDADIQVMNNYSRSAVQGESDVGGFAGLTAAVITRSYSTGAVTQGLTASNLGGFIGRFVNGGTLSAPECYYDQNTSGRSTSAGGTGKTTFEMKDPSTFINYDSDIWDIKSGAYPTLFGPGG